LRFGVPITRLIEGERRRQCALDLVDLFMHRLHGELRVDEAVEVDDLPSSVSRTRTLCTSRIVPDLGCDLGERHLHRAHPLRRAPRARRPPRCSGSM